MNIDERDYKSVFIEMADKTLMLASQVAGDAVKRGVNYRHACHAVKVALYQGLFGSVLRGMKNEGIAPSALKMDVAFAVARDHELVAHEIFKLALDHLQSADPRYVWAVNIAKRTRRPGDR